MDKRTRVLNAMNGLEVDHVPVGFWFHFSGDDALGENCVQAHLKYYRETDLDLVKIMCDGYFPYPLPGVKSSVDLTNLKPLGSQHPFIREQVERARRIVEEIGSERCVFYNVFCPFSSLRFGAEALGMTDSELMEWVKSDKISVMKGLDVIAQSNALLSELLISEAGCDGVYYCVQSGEYDRFTEEEYREIVRPSDLYVLERANRYSENNIIHLCGWAGNKNRMELWQDYPAKTVNWAVHVEDLDLTKGRLFFGGRTNLGGFETHWDETTQQGIIYTGTKEELQEYTRNMIINHGKQGFMIGGDCTIDAKLDWERIRWIVEAARSV